MTLLLPAPDLSSWSDLQQLAVGCQSHPSQKKKKKKKSSTCGSQGENVNGCEPICKLPG
jgi:hypothetical protein